MNQNYEAKNKNATIKEVAQLAEVSQATVGRVIGNYGSVSEKTRAKVMKAAQKLNYTPNAIAQSMRSHITKTVGVVVGNISNQFFAEMVYSLEKSCNKHGFNVLICNTREDVQKEISYLKMLYSKRIDGIVIAPAYMEGQTIAPENMGLYTGDIPTVLVDRKIEGLARPLFHADSVSGAYESTKYLLSLGHRKIGVLSSMNYTTTTERIAGYQKALREYGVAFDENLVRLGNYFDVREMQQITCSLLDTHPDITALFALNNSIFSGVMIELKRRGIRIPQDISLIGWDDVEMAMLMDITMVYQSTEELGRLAAKKLFEMMQFPHRSYVEESIVKTKLIKRKSCRPPF